ncbi:FTR1 family protein [Xenorhabdus sp. TS4]|uniref:FTR1 family iron permease n=1 Tax=Xenorhabdus sp. TS4 TaxID=1873483 RepID=UPI0016572CB4|nr:FTR1 family protein [Xenorhabdus sp. TS4]MBC8949581.1 membrane protein [Xenorhabdus sp. TS4]
MGQVLFVVWRESFEALLVVSIIYAWIKQHPDAETGRRYLWGGVALGGALSLFLALLIYGVFNVLDDSGQTYFMIGMALFACVLIVQMVYWMSQHSASLKSGIEHEMVRSAKHHSWWGALVIVAIAIAREGSEIVVFLSSVVMGLTRDSMWSFTGEVVLGIVIAALTLYLFSLSYQKIAWKWFFRITSIILLFLACSLLLKGVEEISNVLLEHDIELNDFLIYPLWDTSNWLDDSGLIGNFMATLFGYRAQPIGISVLTFAVYWIVVIALFRRQGRRHAA